MTVTNKGITLLIALLLPLLSLGYYCGVLKGKITENENKIVTLEARVVVKDNELKAELEKKVDIEVFNAVNKAIQENITQLREDNTDAHNKLGKGIEGVSSKIDRLIERK